ncbi:MAG TPA: hypothetical protein VMT66_00375 [Steroidobacteraceae bacterium]|nr:hypothetical protein [Steroidobacteraceae bacterium]
MNPKNRLAASWASLLCLFFLNSALADDNPIERLQRARTLRCTYDVESTTAFRADGRKFTTDHDVMVVIYDNIDLRHGTARVVYVKGVAPGAGDVAVRWNGNALSITEIPASTPFLSNAILTTVFARYAEGTKDFIALDSRHSLAFIVVGSMSSGTCTELH